ncbi:hypothetical protein BGW39_002290 [Mortierella sp. 14UC]|nr:hypothetical protein BGW39_002290 [Mortierella sp. 14UC]
MDKLNNHIDDVRELTLGWADLIYLVNCALSTRRHARRVLLAAKTVRSIFVESRIQVRELPPMTRLTKLEFCIFQAEAFRECPYYPLAYNDPKSILVWVNWLIRLNPLLKSMQHSWRS